VDDVRTRAFNPHKASVKQQGLVLFQPEVIGAVSQSGDSKKSTLPQSVSEKQQGACSID
jgi:hypothetical protein